MHRLAPLLACLLALPLAAQGARIATPIDLGVEVQVYPAGVIAAGRLGLALDEQWAGYLLAGWNTTDRQDFGEHDDETGGGPGLGLAGRWYHLPGHRGWYLGGRVDLWFLDIDWDDRRDGRDVAGESEVTVLQPTAQGGYAWQRGGWHLEAGAALGAEINLDTDGEDVGEGAILLLGGAATWRF